MDELQKLGAIPPYLPGIEGSWAFIGYKGTRRVNWVQQISNKKGSGPSKISAIIPLITDDRTTKVKKVKSLGRCTLSGIYEVTVESLYLGLSRDQ